MITSYAQNFEDVILWRALKSVERGFYIDIGAQDPVEESVSLCFYEHGWRGVHVEPTAVYAAGIRVARPDEEVIEAAIGTGTDPLIFYEFPRTGLSTGDPAIARQHAEAGFEMTEHLVPVVSLQSLLDSHAEREVHWLKIDVEGMEAAVIESWGSSVVRPWIVVVESTLPRSNESSHEGWEPQLKGLGYEFVYFDGLNRFYVSEDHPELKVSFGPGPNFFDGFAFPASSKSGMLAPMKQQLVAVEEKKAEVENRLETVNSEAASLNARLVSLEAENARLVSLEADLRNVELARSALVEQVQQLASLTDAFQSSTSWRLTAPLRGLRLVRWPGSLAVARVPKANTEILMRHGLLWLRRRPRAAAFVQRVMRFAPPLERRLLAFARASSGLVTIDTGWALEPDPVALSEWRRLLQGPNAE